MMNQFFVTKSTYMVNGFRVVRELNINYGGEIGVVTIKRLK